MSSVFGFIALGEGGCPPRHILLDVCRRNHGRGVMNDANKSYEQPESFLLKVSGMGVRAGEQGV